MDGRDFSNKVSLCPASSSAVVQVSNCDDDCNAADVSQPLHHFIIVYLPTASRIAHCLSNFIDEYEVEEEKEGANNNKRRSDNDQLLPTSGRVGGEGLPQIQILTTAPQTTNTCPVHVATTTNDNNNNNKSSSSPPPPWFQAHGSTACRHSSRYPCSRTLSSLAPIARLSASSLLAALHDHRNYVEEEEAHVLSSLTLLIEGKGTTHDSLNFLTLIGIPFTDDDHTLPGCLRHPNIAPVLAIFKSSSSDDYINVVFPKTPFTLQNILYYSPCFLTSEWRVMLLTYQLLSALAHMHGLGVAHGNICPSNLMLTDSCWCWLRIFDDDTPLLASSSSSSPGDRTTECSPTPQSSGIDDLDWHSAFNQWRRGELSNFDYLLVLNRLAGRRCGDHTFHTVMPWVIDFTVKPTDTSDATGWRDLSKSKWRLAKGDEQLDFTYSTSEIPHHVSDECLSELAVCSYKARRLPLNVLRRAVRSVYEPNEYPSNMQRLYQWTPDECIPEFYCDPTVFCSRHNGMNDLAVPLWAATPDEFIKLHRDALESDRVSGQIHQWIDITFGYKMSGEAAIDAKNSMLPSSDPTLPKSIGRRQLFTQPHPARRTGNNIDVQGTRSLLLPDTSYLQEMEEAAAFCEHARHLSPVYCCVIENSAGIVEACVEQPLSEGLKGNLYVSARELNQTYGLRSIMDARNLIENIEVDGDFPPGYQEFLLWEKKSSRCKNNSEIIANDIFSAGCILAELHLKRPLFDPTSLAIYCDSGILPRLIQELSPQTRILVEACIRKDWRRRPSAKCLLEAPYFETSVRSGHKFLAPLQLLAKDGLRLHYASSFAKEGALKAMGSFSAEMCAAYCLKLIVAPLSDPEAEWAYILLKEFLKCLKPNAVKTIILPAIQKILQTTGYSHLKVLLLQDSFVREIWKRVGKQVYLETLHPSVISNLHVAPHKSSAAAASVLLIGSSEELGVPVTVHQTILPLIHYFGKGLCGEGIDVLVRIGGHLGEYFIVKQIMPFLRIAVNSCLNASSVSKPEPMQSWSGLALIDCLVTLEGLAAVLSKEMAVKELIQDGSCLHVKILMQTNLELPVLQVAATSLLAMCEQIGPDLTALHVMPKLKGLFDELAFSQETSLASVSLDRSNLNATKPKACKDSHTESRMNLVVVLYPSFASLLGIEKLRQCCATWLLLEQFLLRHHKWKWEYDGESYRGGTSCVNIGRSAFNKSSTSDYSPEKMLLNGVGWSIPQSQGNKSAKMPQSKRANDIPQNLLDQNITISIPDKHEPWHWFPSPAASWDGQPWSFLSSRGGGGNSSTKDEQKPWKIRSSVVHSMRVHHGAVRCLAVCRDDESTVFTGGVGPGFRGSVQKWNFSTVQCTSGYYGHDEVVNDMCVLSSHERVASCDGTVHVWKIQTGKLVSTFAESSTTSPYVTTPLASVAKMKSDQPNMQISDSLSSGILSTAFDGSLYTCMHHLEFNEKLVLGTGNGSLRFIDIPQGDKLHLWRTETGETGFSCLVSSMCSSSRAASWIGAGLSSGMCRLLDIRSGNVISSWRAHDGYITKVAALDDHLLVSSSLDRTLRLWDLRRNLAPQPIIFRGHNDGVSSFSVWGQDVISIARNKIGLSSLSRSSDEDGQHRITPRNLYSIDRGTKNMSILSSLIFLPFSRLFLLGTEDGQLKICC